MILPFAQWLIKASNDDLNPRTVSQWADKVDVSDICYMLAQERHRRGLPVRLLGRLPAAPGPGHSGFAPSPQAVSAIRRVSHDADDDDGGGVWNAASGGY